MRYEPQHETDKTPVGPAEAIIGFIVCVICIGYLLSLIL